MRTCGPKRQEVTRGWRKLHNEELLNLCSSPYARVDEMREACSTHGDREMLRIFWSENLNGKEFN